MVKIKNKNKATLFALIPIVFFSVSGGPYGLEEIVSSVGPVITLLLILILPIIWTIPETLIVSELSSTYPVEGGYYRWVQMSLGHFWGFMEGWWSILYTLVDLSLYPILFSLYLKFIFPDLDFWAIYVLQLFMIWSCALINILGIRVVGNVLMLFQSFILISFAFFVYWGLEHVSFDFARVINTKTDFNFNNLVFGLSLAFWNFIGWDNGSTVLHEVDNPKLNYHKALFISIPIIVLFYFFPTLVGICIHTDWQNWKFGEFSFIANTMNKPLLAMLIAFGGMITCLGLFNSLLLSSTRIFSAMAEDKLLPSFFKVVHNEFNTPYLGIVFVACIYSFLVLVSFQHLIVYDVFLYLIAILLEAISLVILRKKNPNSITNFKIPFGNLGMYFIVGLASCIILFMVVINLFYINGSFIGKLTSIFLLLSGIPVYLYFSNREEAVVKEIRTET